MRARDPQFEGVVSMDRLPVVSIEGAIESPALSTSFLKGLPAPNPAGISGGQKKFQDLTPSAAYRPASA